MLEGSKAVVNSFSNCVFTQVASFTCTCRTCTLNKAGGSVCGLTSARSRLAERTLELFSGRRRSAMDDSWTSIGTGPLTAMDESWRSAATDSHIGTAAIDGSSGTGIKRLQLTPEASTRLGVFSSVCCQKKFARSVQRSCSRVKRVLCWSSKSNFKRSRFACRFLVTFKPSA